MSDFLPALLIPFGLLGFYAAVFSIARLWPTQLSTQLLKQLHLGSWVFLFLTLVGFVALRLSWRGEWVETAAFGTLWLASATYFLLTRKHPGKARKLYFGAWFAYPAALLLAYVADRIFFFIVAVPVLVFLPKGAIYSGAECSLRNAGGFMAPRRVELLVPVYGVLEKHCGTTRAEVPLAKEEVFDSVSSVKLVPQPTTDTTTLLISTRTKQYLVPFPGRD